MTKARILVVDDEPGMLRTVKRVLGGPYEVKTCALPHQALELAARFEPDLAILDIRMPEMDGFQLMDELRVLRPDVDMIIMTGTLHELDTDLIRAIRNRAFYFIQKPFDREVLLTLVDRCLERRNLERKNREYTRRMERGLEEARRFQQSLLPGRAHTFPQARLAARYLPCEKLGGDFYDFAEGRGGEAAFLIADVCGKGPAAAMWAGVLKAAFHAARPEGYEPLAVMREIERGVASFGGSKFVTVYCGRVSSDGRQLEFANAGHPPALLWGNGRTLREIDAPGTAIWPEPLGQPCRLGRVDLEPGDHVLVYTDGITEARGPEALYGDERLLELVETSTHSGDALLEEILGSVDDFCTGRGADDDRTLLTLTARNST